MSVALGNLPLSAGHRFLTGGEHRGQSKGRTGDKDAQGGAALGGARPHGPGTPLGLMSHTTVPF